MFLYVSIMTREYLYSHILIVLLTAYFFYRRNLNVRQCYTDVYQVRRTQEA